MEFQEAIGGGTEVYCPEKGTRCTLGFPAKRVGRYGFVIAGHSGDAVGRRFTYNGKTLGTVGRTAFEENSTADAAFIIAEPGTTVTNILKNGGAIWSAGTNTLPVGTNVSMYGTVSKLQRGKILSTNVVTEIKGQPKIINQWRTDFMSMKIQQFRIFHLIKTLLMN